MEEETKEVIGQETGADLGVITEVGEEPTESEVQPSSIEVSPSEVEHPLEHTADSTDLHQEFVTEEAEGAFEGEGFEETLLQDLEGEFVEPEIDGEFDAQELEGEFEAQELEGEFEEDEGLLIHFDSGEIEEVREDGEPQRLMRVVTFLNIESLETSQEVSETRSDEEDGEWMSSLIPNIEEIPWGGEEETEEIPVRDDTSPAPVLVLEADNPLMKRFQAALKAHLNRQRDRLKMQIHEMEGELKLKTSEKSNLGEMIFRETHLIQQQLATIQEYRKTMAEVALQKDKTDKELAEVRGRLKETTAKLRKTEKRDEALRLEFEALTDIVKQMDDYEKAQMAELSLSQHQSESNIKAKKQLSIEKQQQDYILWRLSKEVMRLSNEYKVLQKNAEDEFVKCDEVAQLLVDAEVDLKGLMGENKIISKAISLAFVTLTKKDKAYHELREKYEEAVQQLQSLHTKTKSYDNSQLSEMKRNEILSGEQLRREDQANEVDRKNQDLSKKLSTMSDQIVKVEQMIELTQEDHDQAVFVSNKLKKSLNVVSREYNSLHQERLDCENQIFNKSQAQITTSLVYCNLKKLIKKIGEENQGQEDAVIECENQLAKMLKDFQSDKILYTNSEIKIDRMKQKVKENELKLKVTKDSLKYLEDQRTLLMNQITLHRSKLLKLEEDKKKGYTVTPVDKKIKDNNEKLNNCIVELNALQDEWLETQNELVSCNEQRSKLLLEINIHKKHLLVCLDKVNRLDNEINVQSNEEKKIKREIVTCQTILQNLEFMVHQKQELSQQMATKTRDIQGECSYLLKKEEESIMDLQREVRELEESNRDDTLVVTELQREYLSWNKKYQLAVETKETIEKEKATFGEIGLMKQEIHRMEIRYTQLRKAQEKLIQDLEMCIYRRDNIIDMAFAREKRTTKGNVSYTRHQFAKKLDDLRNKLKKSEQNIKDAEKQIDEFEIYKNKLTENYEAKQEQLDALRTTIGQLENQLFEGQLHKHKNLEIIVRRQRKCRFLEDIKANKYRLLFKNEKGIEVEEEKQEKLYSNLFEIVEQLMSDFPNLKLQLLQIQNTLKVSVSA